MNASLLVLEYAVVSIALAVLLLDLWLPSAAKSKLGYVAAFALTGVLCASFLLHPETAQFAFIHSYVLDSLSLFFKRLFLVAAIISLLISVDFSDRLITGVSEFYALILFALTGMMLAASANDFAMLFVSLELITVTFYVLTSFQRNRIRSLEAGVKYLILGALSSAFMVYGIALIFGAAGTTRFDAITLASVQLATKPLFLLGLLLTVAGLAFKIASFPFQIWAPDVYQGAPTPAVAFLAVGSKAAGFVLLLRVLYGTVPNITAQWTSLLILISIITILYGNLCAIPQRNLKRLLGYSSIGNAGYLMLGITASNSSGASAILYFLGGYLFSVLAAFAVISIVSRQSDDEDISILAGLHHRSPLLALALTFAFVSLAGIPPLAGFFGKFLLLKSIVHKVGQPGFPILIGVALFGIVVSFYYYLGVVRAIYWSKNPPNLSPISVPTPTRLVLYTCIAGIVYLGIFPNSPLATATQAVLPFKF